MSATGELERSAVMPNAARSVSAARHFIEGKLREQGLGQDLIDTAMLLLSEIVTNAVLHAGTEFSVRYEIDGSGVLVEVGDGNPLLPAPRRHDAEAVTGRGLELVAMLAEHYGVRVAMVGKVVWFTLGGARPPSRGGWARPPRRGEVTVVLAGLPVRLYSVLQEQSEALLREFELAQLNAAADAEIRRDIAEAARARVCVASAFLAAVSRAEEPAARMDLRLIVGADARHGFEVILGVLAQAEAMAVTGTLLTPPSLPELLALRHWLYGQIQHQLHGGSPVPWSPPSAYPDGPATPAVEVDVGWVSEAGSGVVVADDTNHILAISAAAADLLGWDGGELAGQRLMVIIPPRLHEAHVAGFTRQLVTGRETLIGREVTVPALHRDGTEVPVRLRIERRNAATRAFYVAWMDPA